MKKTNTIFRLGCLLLLVCILPSKTIAQIDPGFSLYRIYPQVINPGYTGAVENTELLLSHRNQWMEIAGSPKSVGAMGNFKTIKQKGFGFTVLYDQAGPVRATYISGDFSYHLKLNDQWKFSGGIRGGLSNTSLDFTGLSLKDAGDPSFAQNFSTGINPNLGWGLRFSKKNDEIYVGISQPRLIWNNFGIYEGAYKDVSMLYTMVGGNYKINDLISINPNALFRLAADIPNSWEVNVTANLMKLVDFGVGYRSMNSFSTNLGVNFNSKMYLGYLYEIPTTEISQVSNQTHEIVFRYRLIKENLPQYYKKKKSFKEMIDVRKYFRRK